MHLATYLHQSHVIPFFLRAQVGTVVLAVIASVSFILRRPGRSADLFFGVTVAPTTATSPPGIIIERRYTRRLLMHALIASTLAVSSILIPTGPPIYIALLLLSSLWVTFGATVAFVKARGEALSFAVKPSMVREASLDLDDPEQARTRGLLLLQSLPLALLCVAALFAAVRYDHIPPRFAVHFDAAGNPDRYSTRTLVHVFMPFVVSLVLWGMMAMIGWVIVHASRKVRTDGEVAVRQAKYQRAVLLILLIAESVTSIIFAVLIAHAAMPGQVSMGRHSMVVTVIGIVGMLSAVTVIAVRATQDEQRGNLAVAGTAPIGDGTPDSCWRWGILYVNRQDPSIVVPKRFGIGYTMNFGNAAAWLVVGIMLACIATVMLLPRLARL